ncbi:MAG: hypothetical protein SF029_03985 [bacterium]|nr:hypothetical protein [bacterium]
MTANISKPGRPLGVTLAIFVSILLFSVVPLLRVGQILLLQQHFQRISQTTMPFDQQEPTEPLFSGGRFTGTFQNDRLIFQAVVGVAFFVIAVMAWVGKPPFMRYVLMITVLCLSFLTIALTLIPSAQQEAEGIGGGSLDGLVRLLSSGQVVTTVLVALYVVWYLNRGPARAFYRGYYLPEPEAQPALQETSVRMNTN